MTRRNLLTEGHESGPERVDTHASVGTLPSQRDTIKLRGPPKSFTYQAVRRKAASGQGNDLGYGKNGGDAARVGESSLYPRLNGQSAAKL